MGVSVVTHSNAAELVQFFGAVYADSVPAARESINAGAELILEGIRKRIEIDGDGVPSSPGQPPRRQSGDYHDSWGVSYATGDIDLTAAIGTDAPQGRRLEWGFHGLDSLGRHFDQAPRPHVGPTIQEVEPLVAADLFDRVLFLNFKGASTDFGAR